MRLAGCIAPASSFPFTLPHTAVLPPMRLQSAMNAVPCLMHCSERFLKAGVFYFLFAIKRDVHTVPATFSEGSHLDDAGFLYRRMNIMLRVCELPENVHAQMEKGIEIQKVKPPPDVRLFHGKVHP